MSRYYLKLLFISLFPDPLYCVTQMTLFATLIHFLYTRKGSMIMNVIYGPFCWHKQILNIANIPAKYVNTHREVKGRGRRKSFSWLLDYHSIVMLHNPNDKIRRTLHSKLIFNSYSYILKNHLPSILITFSLWV